MLDRVILYKQSGEMIDHWLDSTMTNSDRLKLFSDLVGGKVCGADCKDLDITVFVKCDGLLKEDGLNDAASQLCGTLVSGDAIIVEDTIVKGWNKENDSGNG